MTHTYFRLIALISSPLFFVAAAYPATSPRYGGTLHLELAAPKASLDPREWQAGSVESATNEILAALVYDRLVTLDNYGRFRPVLATEWSHDASNKRWQFTIRAGVKFSDGSPLTVADVVAALQPLLPETLQISAASATAFAMQSSTPVPDLLEQLASGRFFVYRVLANGEFAGTGPFVVGDAPGTAGSSQRSGAAGTPAGNAGTAARSSAHLYFRDNEDAWSGRPFLDAIDVTLGVPPLRAMFDLQLGKADLVELSPELVPRARQANVRVWLSEPLTLYGLRFDPSQAAASDPRLRQALSLALDRETMAGVLLQKQATPAAALLPQWLSGYAFLFNVESNPERAKELRRSQAGGAGTSSEPLKLRVDVSGDLPKLLGERVAVNARQSGILVQVVAKTIARGAGAAQPAGVEPPAGVHLFVWHYSSLSARAELDAMFAAYNLSEPSEMNLAGTEREQLYARERSVLEEWRVLPLVAQAEPVGLGANVRDWMPSRWGEWHLEEVWLDASQPASASSATMRYFDATRGGASGVRQ